MLRRWGVPVALTALSAASAIVGLRTPPAANAGPGPSSAATAVLSPRRASTLLADAVAAGRLHTALDRVLDDSDLGGGRDNSCLIVADGHATLYERQPNLALTPASTMKLLTATAVLLLMDPNAHLTTRAVSTQRINNGVLDGDLYIVGGGDPLLASADYEAGFKDQPRRFTDLNGLADALVHKAGIRSITGAIKGDDSRYDAQRYVPTWKQVYATDGDVGPLSALMYNDDFAQWKPKAVPTPVPAGYAAAALTDLLKARGVTVDGAPTEGAAPNATTVASLESLAIRDIVGEMLVHSDNETAELLTKELGHRFGAGGTTEAGIAVIRRALTNAGVDVREVVSSDGSGLAPTDKLSCRVLQQLLTGPTRAALLRAGLATAAQTGTMYDRYQNGNPAAGRLHGKTGTLAGVVGLAGVIDPATKDASDGLTFAFLANSLPTPSEARGKRFLDKLAAVLAVYPNRPAAASLSP